MIELALINNNQSLMIIGFIGLILMLLTFRLIPAWRKSNPIKPSAVIFQNNLNQKIAALNFSLNDINATIQELRRSIQHSDMALSGLNQHDLAILVCLEKLVAEIERTDRLIEIKPIEEIEKITRVAHVYKQYTRAKPRDSEARCYSTRINK
jgi:hypothetical protein